MVLESQLPHKSSFFCLLLLSKTLSWRFCGGVDFLKPINKYIVSDKTATNPHDKTKSTNLDLRFTLTETPKKGSLSIHSTDLYRGVITPIFGNQSLEINWIVRAALQSDVYIYLYLYLYYIYIYIYIYMSDCEGQSDCEGWWCHPFILEGSISRTQMYPVFLQWIGDNFWSTPDQSSTRVQLSSAVSCTGRWVSNTVQQCPDHLKIQIQACPTHPTPDARLPSVHTWPMRFSNKLLPRGEGTVQRFKNKSTEPEAKFWPRTFNVCPGRSRLHSGVETTLRCE